MYDKDAPQSPSTKPQSMSFKEMFSTRRVPAKKSNNFFSSGDYSNESNSASASPLSLNGVSSLRDHVISNSNKKSHFSKESENEHSYKVPTYRPDLLNSPKLKPVSNSGTPKVLSIVAIPSNDEKKVSGLVFKPIQRDSGHNSRAGSQVNSKPSSIVQSPIIKSPVLQKLDNIIQQSPSTGKEGNYLQFLQPKLNHIEPQGHYLNPSTSNSHGLKDLLVKRIRESDKLKERFQSPMLQSLSAKTSLRDFEQTVATKGGLTLTIPIEKVLLPENNKNQAGASSLKQTTPDSLRNRPSPLIIQKVVPSEAKVVNDLKLKTPEKIANSPTKTKAIGPITEQKANDNSSSLHQTEFNQVEQLKKETAEPLIVDKEHSNKKQEPDKTSTEATNPTSNTKKADNRNKLIRSNSLLAKNAMKLLSKFEDLTIKKPTEPAAEMIPIDIDKEAGGALTLQQTISLKSPLKSPSKKGSSSNKYF